MEEIDKIEEKLKNKGWKGNLEATKVRGGQMDLVKVRRKAFWRHFCIYAFSSAALCAISVSATWFVMRSHEQAGNGETDEAASYVKKLGEYYYPTAVGNLSNNKTVYADFYYAFDDESTGYFAIDLNTNRASRIVFKNEEGSILCVSATKLTNFGLTSLFVTFSSLVTTTAGLEITFSLQTINLTPFYNSALSE